MIQADLQKSNDELTSIKSQLDKSEKDKTEARETLRQEIEASREAITELNTQLRVNALKIETLESEKAKHS